MKYMCDDFKELKFKNGLQCTVGMFGENIYAMRLYTASGHNSYYSQYFRIERNDLEEYPENAGRLVEKYCDEKVYFLCSDYMGKAHHTYSFED